MSTRPRRPTIARLRRWLPPALTAAVVLFAARTLWRQWRSVQGTPLTPHLDPWWLLVSSLVVLATYALLVETWRQVLRLWGAPVPFAEAARVWSISNLGKYLPGKVWQLSAMTVMLRRFGVSLVVAGSAALVVTIGNLVAGFGVALALGGRAFRATLGDDAARVAVAAIVVGGAALVLSPWLVGRVALLAARLRGRRDAPAPVAVPHAAPWVAVSGCAVAWLAYGAAFQLFARAVLGHPSGDLLRWTVAYTLSYLIGYVALFAPGGIGVRELALVTALGALQLATPAEAVLLTVASRLWLTVLELVPGLAFLARDRRHRARHAAAADVPPPA